MPVGYRPGGNYFGEGLVKVKIGGLGHVFFGRLQGQILVPGLKPPLRAELRSATRLRLRQPSHPASRIVSLGFVALIESVAVMHYGSCRIADRNLIVGDVARDHRTGADDAPCAEDDPG